MVLGAWTSTKRCDEELTRLGLGDDPDFMRSSMAGRNRVTPPIAETSYSCFTCMTASSDGSMFTLNKFQIFSKKEIKLVNTCLSNKLSLVGEQKLLSKLYGSLVQV